ncbi:MAG: LamG domain-containing protein [Planctomycetaceae bacterium]|nr:LamG domain-containing protein [Planctomycetaceae bacterium]
MNWIEAWQKNRLRLAAICAIISLSTSAFGAVKVRYYPMGEADAGATVGGVALMTEDIMEPPTENANGDPVSDDQGEFVPLEAVNAGEAPTYVDGRDGAGSLALEFDGDSNLLSSGSFDPRNFSSFAALSQAWVKPSSEGSDTEQFIWGLGTDNGGVGITPDNVWQIRASRGVPDLASDVAVEFDAWTHVAIFRGGNGASLYINGQLEATGDAFWNGPGPVAVGSMLDGTAPFAGTIDDFNIAGFSDFSFDPTRDLDFEPPIEPSGVAGDVDQNGIVNQDDYLIWSDNVGFNNDLGAGDVSTLVQGDVDQNGRINFFDFQIIAEQAAAAGAELQLVPEPTSLTLLGLGIFMMLQVRRRQK